MLPPDVDAYVVAVTGGDERKNTEGLLRGWGRLDPALRSSHHLVIATAHSPAVLRRWEGWAAEAGISDRVVFTGSVDDDEMVSILQGARLAVMPSLEEGFGLPVVEAAACGVPVICSNFTSLPEVLDEPAACFDPRDPDAIAHAIGRGLTDESYRQVLLSAGEWAAQRWTWPRVADDLVDGLAKLGPRWDRPIRLPRPRLAIVGPADGSDSAIGRYDEDVLAALTRQPDVPEFTMFVDGSASDRPTGPGRWPVRSIGRYHKPWDVDHIVAVLGSSPSHVATADLATRVPCHVWMHEASLVGVHLGLAHASGSETWATEYVREQLTQNESAGTVSSLAATELLDAPHLDDVGITLIAGTLDRSRSVIVSSERAAETVRSVRPDGPPLLVLPLAFPTAAAGAAESPPARNIVAVGWLAANKAPLVALDVLHRLGPAVDATLTFVGPTVDAIASEVAAEAERLGIADRVTITGRLDADDYRRCLAGARSGSSSVAAIEARCRPLSPTSSPTVSRPSRHSPPPARRLPGSRSSISTPMRSPTRSGPY